MINIGGSWVMVKVWILSITLNCASITTAFVIAPSKEACFQKAIKFQEAYDKSHMACFEAYVPIERSKQYKSFDTVKVWNC